MSIGAMSRLSGVSVHTLRYYENIGLLERARRNNAGHRVYSAEDLDWVALLRCLRTSGMPIGDVKIFSTLVRSGGGIPARVELLDREKKLQGLQDALGVINEKLCRYRSIDAEQQKALTTTANEEPIR
jgi:DNA-binding transcriptional MerR regulator